MYAAIPYVTARAKAQGSLWSAKSNITKTINQTVTMPNAKTSKRRKKRINNLIISPAQPFAPRQAANRMIS